MAVATRPARGQGDAPPRGRPGNRLELYAWLFMRLSGILLLFLAATVLAASLVPTTLAAHRFWEEEDPRARAAQRVHFQKNCAMLGGLILAAVDTGGRPSLGWRARRAARRAVRALPTTG